MKIAISGKGGVGKTLIAAFLSRAFADAGYAVIAVDADPDANLGRSLGFTHADEVVPISEMKELIEERTGAKPGEAVSFYKLNPRVSDIPQKYALKQGSISLMVMGRVKGGGTGCYCPENSLLQALMAHLLLSRNEAVIMDMAAGIEHLGRGTAKMVDRLIIVVEPGGQSLETAVRIKRLAEDLGIKSTSVIGNKLRGERDEEFIRAGLPGFEFLGFLPYAPEIARADMAGGPVLEASRRFSGQIGVVFQSLLSSVQKPDLIR